MNIDALKQRFEAAGQGHLFEGFDRLTADQQQAYAAELQSVDLDQVAELCAQHLHAEPEAVDPDAIEPVDIVALPTSADEGREAVERGEAALRAGEVGIVLVAGGQGSRLGYEHPKGCYQCMPVSRKSLFEVHVERARAIAARYGKPAPYYIMTSPATHEETVAFFEANAFFGMDPADVRFFQQGVMPAVDLQGRLLRSAPDHLFFSPNGHGGVLKALRDSGCLADMDARGVTTVFYHQVDNPLVKVCDPWFIGHHLLADAEFSLRVIDKNGPFDKLGNTCLYRGRPTIIEYSDLPDELAERRNPDGGLWLLAGSIAIHAFSVAFLKRLTDGTLALPTHAARKKIPYDLDGAPIEATVENGMKFEMFVFDALPLADRCVVAQTTRRREYEALKNATGPHSPEAVKQAISNVCAEWLREAGVDVPVNGDGNTSARIEIGPLYALDRQELAAKAPAGLKVERELVLG